MGEKREEEGRGEEREEGRGKRGREGRGEEMFNIFVVHLI